MRRHVVTFLLLSALTVSAASAQRIVSAPLPAPLAAPQQTQESTVSPRFLASAVLPGSAQYLAGDDRWVPYVALEAWGWLSYFQQRGDARRAEREYRDLAYQVARRVSVGARRDSTFTYYEAMAHNAASGSFDTDPGLAGVQPEVDPNTFNGQMWTLARELNFAFGAEPGTPAYNAALAYYTSHAIPASHAWAWGGSLLEQQAFVRLIDDSDRGYRSATRYLGVLLANHIASAVDALVTERLRKLGAHGVRMETIPRREADGMRWEYGLRYTFR